MGDEPLIAVIDDDASARGAARSLIGSLGFAVVTFGSPEAFLASGVVETVACLVVEMRMTHMIGDDVRHRRAAAGKAIPMIATTKVPHAATRRWTREAGIVACLEKPLEPESMTRALRAALEPDATAS
ncbi:response regulator [Aquibium sp. ELW1220]|jgi:FixJ family two-component response regulator|uniref:response regulator n=1 Tax=Aquibium sp. ELW1220 TaxID=2976766 RepID=UPI0025B00517|nr:response regulator [Aquibium sp. ELW1220]MDN2583862.1 response regulator [Aquibium sp. ELW1220]